MSEAQNLREAIVANAEPPHERSAIMISNLVGKLAEIDAPSALIAAEHVSDPSMRVNALVRVGRVSYDAAPMYDAYEVAQSLGGDEGAKARKLEFVAKNVLQIGKPDMALEITRSGIQKPGAKARMLIKIAETVDNLALFHEAEREVVQAGIGRDFDEHLMSIGMRIDYALGMRANKRHVQRTEQPEYRPVRAADYTLRLVLDASKQEDFSLLNPIIDDVFEAIKIATHPDHYKYPRGFYSYAASKVVTIDFLSGLASFIVSKNPHRGAEVYKAILNIVERDIKKAEQQAETERKAKADKVIRMREYLKKLIELDDETLASLSEPRLASLDPDAKSDEFGWGLEDLEDLL